jgi:predicted nucleotidyltransferase
MPFDIENLRQLALEAIRDFEPSIEIVYLYGSRATGTSNGESDFDFAVAAGRPLEGRERAALQGRFMDAVDSGGYDPEVDLVDMRRIPLTLASQILEYGIVLVGERCRERGFLETRLMSQYAQLNEERREVIEAIVARGSVYADA